MFDPSPSTLTLRERREAIFTFGPLDHLPRQEFYFWQETLARWREEGLPEDWAEQNYFGFDQGAGRGTDLGLGWVESPLWPPFEWRVLEETADYQVVSDQSGRVKRIFRDRPSLAMPTYLRHCAETWADWEENVKPRLDPDSPARWEAFEAARAQIAADSAAGAPPYWLSQSFIGGYMYLRNMFGPEGVMYALYDQPDLVHDMMATWLRFMDASLARVQAAYALDEILLAEDICYKHGLLISPAQVREFLLPYYQELVTRARARNSRRLFLSVDSDGCVGEALRLYLEVGMDLMMPFEVAAGNDLLQVAVEYPGLSLLGGLDKRLLSDGADLAVLDRALERLVPFMLKRGGWIPTMDHGVPPDVPLRNYLHYRERMLELDH